ncbi:MAG: hypothetical protein ACJ8AO_02095 [Gemmatimonadaceae bacterium]
MRLHALALAALALGTGGPLAAQEWRTLDVSRQLRDTTPLHVRVSYGSGKAALRAVDSPALYQMQLKYDARRAEPVHVYDAEGRSLRLGVTQQSMRFSGNRDMDGAEMRLDLTRSVPLDLSLELGAVEADLDLSGLRLEALKLETGASETRLRFDAPNTSRMRALDLQVGAASFRGSRLANANADEVRVRGTVGEVELDFGGQWTRDVELHVEVTLGSVTVHVPADVGVRLELDRFLSSFEHDGMTKRGGAWVSDNWETARYHLRIKSRSALGSFELDHR